MQTNACSDQLGETDFLKFPFFARDSKRFFIDSGQAKRRNLPLPPETTIAGVKGGIIPQCCR
ncbi:MAG: hypothetical protein HW380_1155 [Magnetococcales bacterium]|nr:hypothetical protein [Magnetococcales bacterium]